MFNAKGNADNNDTALVARSARLAEHQGLGSLRHVSLQLSSYLHCQPCDDGRFNFNGLHGSAWRSVGPLLNAAGPGCYVPGTPRAARVQQTLERTWQAKVPQMSMGTLQEGMDAIHPSASHTLPEDMDSSVPGEGQALEHRLLGLPANCTCQPWHHGVSWLGHLGLLLGPSAFQVPCHPAPKVKPSQMCSANNCPPAVSYISGKQDTIPAPSVEEFANLLQVQRIRRNELEAPSRSNREK